MRLGCCAYSYRDELQAGRLTLEGFLDRCVELGMAGVELTAYYFKDTSPPALREVKRQAYLRGLDICGTAVGSSFTARDAEHRRGQIAMVSDWIERSVTLGAPGIRVFAGEVPPDSTEDAAFANTVEALKECARIGERHGVVVALENHGGITSTADQTLKLLRAVDHPWFGINLDLGNFRGAPYDEIARVAPHAVTAHAKVSVGGEKLDYSRIFEILDRERFRGYVNIEYEEREDPATGVPAFAEELKSALATVD